jgi:hypothetical protein
MHNRDGLLAAIGAFIQMRRTLTLGLLVLLPGCTGFGTFLDHTFTLPDTNPNLPMADSENVRRSLGQQIDVAPLAPEAGNVWPGPQAPEPTLTDVQQRSSNEDNQGFGPTTVPGATPGLPAGRQPRPTTRGSSTPPGSVEPGLAPLPQNNVPPPPPQSSVPRPGPQGLVVPTPSGPAVDAGGTSGYRQLTTPQGPGAIMVPNGNGTSTIINPNGSIQTVPTPR